MAQAVDFAGTACGIGGRVVDGLAEWEGDDTILGAVDDQDGHGGFVQARSRVELAANKELNSRKEPEQLAGQDRSRRGTALPGLPRLLLGARPGLRPRPFRAIARRRRSTSERSLPCPRDIDRQRQRRGRCRLRWFALAMAVAAVFQSKYVGRCRGEIRRPPRGWQCWRRFPWNARKVNLAWSLGIHQA